jgi:DNA-binding ferritin-like protein (Dps family)
MPKMTVQIAEEALRKEVEKLDKRAQLLAVNDTKNKDEYRVTLLKAGNTGNAAIKKDVLEAFIAGEGKGNEVRKALGKAVSHLSIKYGR